MKLILDHITYKYNKDTAREKTAVNDVSLVINEGEFVCLIGHTGSGKSTLIQHFNGLLKPDSGSVFFNGEDIFDKDYDRKKLRGKVGLVFQYPEHQLFEENAFKDVCFGPLNMGLTKKEAELRAYEVMKMVGIEDELFYQSPFNMSGGQKRKIAIAGVLAMNPEVLVLDEPTAGLDPKGRDDMLNMIKRLQLENNISIILVSHSMEDVSNYADRIVVMNKGEMLFNDTPKKVFSHYKELEKIGLKAPFATYLADELRDNGFDISDDVTTNDEIIEEIVKSLS